MVFANYPSLHGARVLITGGASGIGAEIAKQFLLQYAHVTVFDIDDDAAANLIVLTSEAPYPFPVRYVYADLRDIDALRQNFAANPAEFDILVNNAARDDRHDWETMEVEYWDERLATNLRHIPFLIQAIAPGMKERRRGSIINLGSTSWMKGQGEMPAYIAAKAAIVGLTRGYARVLGPWGIRVNEVRPGWIFTERQNQLYATPDAVQFHLDAQCLKEQMLPAEVARMVLWLAADDSRMISGQHFIADAGSV